MAYEATLPPPAGCLPVNIAESPESIILNSKINGDAWPYNSKTGLPHVGIWTFDYVHKVKPPAGAHAIDEEEFLTFIGWRFGVADVDSDDENSGHSGNDLLSQDDAAPQMQLSSSSDSSGDAEHLANEAPSNTELPSEPQPTSLSDWELVPPLSSPQLQNDLHERARGLCTTHWFTLRHAMMLVQRLGSLNLQIDVIVSLWPRIIDWHGFDQVAHPPGRKRIVVLFHMFVYVKQKHPHLDLQLLDMLPTDGAQAVKTRLGHHNVFDSVSAIQFYLLDLQNVQHRCILGHLVRLAVIEPGENCIQCHFNDLPFDIPASWCTALPSSGEFYLYYCRERAVIDTIAAKAEQRNPGSVPCNYSKRQPEGQAWVVPAQRRRVRDKLRSIFPSASACFAAFDEDGGGSLSRQELAKGLRNHKIFLHPSDLIRYYRCCCLIASSCLEVDCLLQLDGGFGRRRQRQH
jgi:hypothetical protein